jgi:death-on-curing protein
LLDVEQVVVIHDELVSRLWPGTELVEKGSLRDRGLLEAALARPFQSAFGEDAYPTILGKAAALFHSLIANHCFVDGNKRTAVLALQGFLVANSFVVFLDDETVYNLARETAAHNVRGVSAGRAYQDVLHVLEETTVHLSQLRPRRKDSLRSLSTCEELRRRRRVWRMRMRILEN